MNTLLIGCFGIIWFARRGLARDSLSGWILQIPHVLFVILGFDKQAWWSAGGTGWGKAEDWPAGNINVLLLSDSVYLFIPITQTCAALVFISLTLFILLILIIYLSSYALWVVRENESILGPDPSQTLNFGLQFRSVQFWAPGVRQVSRSSLHDWCDCKSSILVWSSVCNKQNNGLCGRRGVSGSSLKVLGGS